MDDVGSAPGMAQIQCSGLVDIRWLGGWPWCFTSPSDLLCHREVQVFSSPTDPPAQVASGSTSHTGAMTSDFARPLTCYLGSMSRSGHTIVTSFIDSVRFWICYLVSIFYLGESWKYILTELRYVVVPLLSIFFVFWCGFFTLSDHWSIKEFGDISYHWSIKDIGDTRCN